MHVANAWRQRFDLAGLQASTGSAGMRTPPRIEGVRLRVFGPAEHADQAPDPMIVYQTSAIIHGGERNYIMATISLYVSIYNLFISLLQIFGIAGGDD